MFEHLYPQTEGRMELGSYVTFRTQIRERLIAGAVGILIGLALGAVLYIAGAAS